MDTRLEALKSVAGQAGPFPANVVAFLTIHDCAHTAGHSRKVAVTGRRLAARFGLDEGAAEVAGWLHDISAVIPNDERLAAAQAWAVPVLAEERRLPMILHQKLSLVIARECFAVQDKAVLSAIGCHTTLKADAAPLDQLVFVADKIAWDQPGSPPYLADLEAALTQSLTDGALVYINYLWARRATMAVVHPWLVAAREALLPAG